MTNNQQTRIDQQAFVGRDLAMQTYTDHSQAMVRDRIRAREAEAAAERLAAVARPRRSGRDPRTILGAALIRLGEALVGEPSAMPARTARRPHATA